MTSISRFYTIHYGKPIGTGLTGKVYEAKRKSDKELVAVKFIARAKLDGPKADCISNEIVALKTLNHPNIVKLFDVFEDAKNFYLVMEYIRGGQLLHRIEKKKFYNERDARDVCKQILSAIQHCHSHDMVHRDIKPENLVMLDDCEESSDVKLIDFGFTAVADGTNLSGRMGTPAYMAPEIWGRQLYGKSVDMWAFGVIVFILLCGYPPFQGSTQDILESNIMSGILHFEGPQWQIVSAEAKLFITKLLITDPAKRLTVDEAIEDEWLKCEADVLECRSLESAKANLSAFNAKRKLKAVVQAVIATMKMKRQLGISSAEASSIEVVISEAAQPASEVSSLTDLSSMGSISSDLSGSTTMASSLHSVDSRLSSLVKQYSRDEFEDSFALEDQNLRIVVDSVCGMELGVSGTFDGCRIAEQASGASSGFYSPPSDLLASPTSRPP